MKFSDYMEKKKHGSPDFPLQYYYIDQSHPQYIMPPHWHKEFEIIRVLKGEFRVFLNNVEFLLTQDDILLVECGYLHRGDAFDCEYECIVFDTNMLQQQQKSIIQKYLDPITNSEAKLSPLVYHKESALHAPLSSLFEVMKHKKPFYEMQIYALLFEIFFALYSGGNVKQIANAAINHQVKNISRILDWIEKDFTEHITLELLAKKAGLNPKYLCRLFKEYTSKTVVEYVTERRIENACFELASGKSVTAAAFDSGFNDLSYFCKTFKKIKAISPSEYKKKNQLV